MWRRGSGKPARALVVAHRAGRSLGAAGPIEAIERIVAVGADMVEIDVRATRDGTLVVRHDPVADEAAAHGEPLVRLADYLEALDGRIALDLEIKEPGHEAAIVAALRARTDPARVVVTSFSDASIAAVKALAPELGTGLLVGSLHLWLRGPRALRGDVDPFGRLSACGADFLAPNHRLLATGLARRAERRGVGLLVWTVNTGAGVARTLHDPRVLGVVTDDPGLALATTR